MMLSRLVCLFAGLLIGLPLSQAREAESAPVVAQGTLQAAFSPWEDVEELVMNEIDGAKKQVLVQAYLLTSKKIAATLISAHRRGVEVRVLADAAQHDKVATSRLSDLAASGVDVSLETKYQNAHNKVMVIDAGMSRATLITGSFNFTWTAQHKNAENILIARNNPALALRYASNWTRHHRDAIPFKK